MGLNKTEMALNLHLLHMYFMQVLSATAIDYRQNFDL